MNVSLCLSVMATLLPCPQVPGATGLGDTLVYNDLCSQLSLSVSSVESLLSFGPKVGACARL